MQSHINVTQCYQKNDLPVDILAIGGGAACFLGTSSFLSQVIGYGFQTPIDALRLEIKAIEDFYGRNGHHRVDIELCPFVGSGIANIPTKNGYDITEFNNVSYMALDSDVLTKDDEGFQTFIPEDDDLHDFAHAVAQGFECLDAVEQFYLYAKSDGVAPFAAMIGDEIAAGGTIAIHEGVCYLGVTSTKPNYRGRGLQKALVNARLAFAKSQGATLASVTTEPGSISEGNIQKMGFKIAYTRVKLSRLFTPK
jgi:GNAT superfamily N-acetyltransferase